MKRVAKFLVAVGLLVGAVTQMNVTLSSCDS